MPIFWRYDHSVQPGLLKTSEMTGVGYSLLLVVHAFSCSLVLVGEMMTAFQSFLQLKEMSLVGRCLLYKLANIFFVKQSKLPLSESPKSFFDAMLLNLIIFSSSIETAVLIYFWICCFEFLYLYCKMIKHLTSKVKKMVNPEYI